VSNDGKYESKRAAEIKEYRHRNVAVTDTKHKEVILE
jgi:hypothetical protein